MNIAIACQGGGSHTAFTAGVLSRLLPDLPGELVGLSGTSGGAITAATAWSARRHGEDVPDALEALWADIAAESPAERVANDTLTGWSRLRASGFPLPEFSPYVTPNDARRDLRAVIEEHVTFDPTPDCPKFVVGTVDINGGCFEAFVDEDITPEVLLASAAVPDLFRAVEMNGHYHWDGLFSQNPPVHELFTGGAESKPDELWVVQINPQTREGEPKSLMEIADRRNELSGNISLNQELNFVERVNDWVEAGHLPEDEYAHTEIRRIELGQELELGHASKLDRSPAFIEDLLEAGRARADAFLDDL
ncbi:patatin-like phospholipase family protein [Natronomonas sp. EA1]|uniref:patatin-like phospholipase family protein n=1 Tax=Natronomonas sp. EA1 TaxID=3421655 RepID=UPI003EBC7B6E